MLIEHSFKRGPAGVCFRCAAPRRLHRYDRNNAVPRKRQPNRAPSIRPRDRIIGIDGEGKGRKPHRYTYLAAHDEKGRHWEVRNEAGLTTEQCLDLLLSLPPRSLCFGFAFLYDLTKICQDIDDDNLYALFHEDTRAKLVEGRQVYTPIHWRGYTLNYVHRRFTVQRGTRTTIIWDIFAFFQSKFTKALTDWQVASADRLKEMERMKALRSEFDKQSNEEIERYCNEECAYLGNLGRRLINAHDAAGLNLRAYHGAGSTASAFLAKIDIKQYRGEIPLAMRLAVACAFFGGRFENARIGPIGQRAYNYDISSAYPYWATAMPCLSCGRWRHSRTLPKRADLTLIHWTRPPGRQADWGTLPVRLPRGWNGLSQGTIVFPLGGAGGWTWAAEFEAARRIDPGIEVKECWYYETDCDHKPFADVPGVYRERVKLGKDAQGIVLKLGLNSIYGKLAQSVGLNPPFQSWVWAGNITSGCRAQLLDAIRVGSAQRPWSVLMVATDGVWTTERLDLPKPRDTGTGDLPKPLGGWEEKIYEQGVFCVRPGIYFPLRPNKDQMDAVRARGLGRKVVYEQWERIARGWDRRQREVVLGGVQRFVGAKTGFSIAKGKIKRRRVYGEWIQQRIKCSFSARPKRERRINADCLAPWKYVNTESIPYDHAVPDDAAAMVIDAAIAEEQPNVDFQDLE